MDNIPLTHQLRRPRRNPTTQSLPVVRFLIFSLTSKLFPENPSYIKAPTKTKMNSSYERYANHRAFASPGFANVAQPFSTPRTAASATPRTPPKMADIPADHLELYCLQTARSSRHSPFLFFQGIGIEDDDAWTQLEYFQQVLRLPFSIPFQPDHDFKGSAREDGHRNSTQKRLNLILSIQEPRIFATDWGLPLASHPDEIVHPYMVANCLTKKVREGEGGRLIAVSRAVSVQDTLIAPDHLHQWQPAGYFSGLDSTLNCCLGSLKVAVKATCISMLLADGKKDLARLADSHLDFTWRHITFRLDGKQHSIHLGELYFCEDPALIDDPLAVEYTRVIAPLLSHLFLSSDRTKNHALVNIHGARLCFSSPNIKLPTPSSGHIRRLIACSDTRTLYPVAFDGLKPATPIFLLVCRWYQLGLPPHSVVRAFHGTLDRPVEPTRLKDRWLLVPKPILWFNTLETAMAIVKRIALFAPLFTDYWDSDLVPMSVRPLFAVPPRHEMLPHFAPLAQGTSRLQWPNIIRRWRDVTDTHVAKQLTLPEGTVIPRQPLFTPATSPSHARSTSPGKRQHVDNPSTISDSSLDAFARFDFTDPNIPEEQLEEAITSLLRNRVLRHAAYGLQFAEQLVETLKHEVRVSSRFVVRDYTQLDPQYDSGMHLSGLSDCGEDAPNPGFYDCLAAIDGDDDSMSESAAIRGPFTYDGEREGPHDLSTDI